MKVPLNWLRDYVTLSTSIPDLVDRLTISGLEVANVRLIGLPVPEGLRVKQTEIGPVWDKDKILTAQVLAIEKHPECRQTQTRANRLRDRYAETGGDRRSEHFGGR